MKRLGFALLLAALLGIGLIPASASAKTCSDYSNQRDAQEGADTRDADGDGKYCESLPCPCSGSGKKKSGGGGKKKSTKKKKPKKKPKPTYTYEGNLVQVVDGDTIKVELDSGKTTTVRLIGIDTPESVKPGVPVECGALEAKSAAIKWGFGTPVDADANGLFESGIDGITVTLITDNTQSRYDKYGRLLAYVYNYEGASLQRALLKAGWADTYYYGEKSFKKAGPYERDWAAASDASAGVFGSCGGNFHSAQ